MDASSKKFSSPQEEITYWREAAQRFKQEVEESREELEEFQISSRELEAELEAQVEQLEKKNNNLQQQNSKYQHEVESLREKDKKKKKEMSALSSPCYTATTPRRTMQEVEKAARKKGRAYWCLRCLHRSNKEYIDVKYRMEAHIIKDHLRRDEVPFFCSLCQFRCTKEEELSEHLTRYRRHKDIALRSKVDPLDTSCLKSNTEPYKIGPKDYLVMEKEESFEHWKTCILRRQATTEPEPDSLTQAMTEVFGDCFEPGTSTSLAQDQGVFVVHDPPLSEVPQLPAAASMLHQSQIKEVVSPFLQQLSAIIDPSLLTEMMHSEKTIPVSEGSQVAQVLPTHVTLATPAPMEETPLARPKHCLEENILDQILTTESSNITPKRKIDEGLVPNKKMRSRSPSPAPSTCSSSSEESQRGKAFSPSKATDTQGIVQNEREIRALTNVVMSNTIAIRSLESSVLTLAEASTVLTKNLKENQQKPKSEEKTREKTHGDTEKTKDNTHKRNNYKQNENKSHNHYNKQSNKDNRKRSNPFQRLGSWSKNRRY